MTGMAFISIMSLPMALDVKVCAHADNDIVPPPPPLALHAGSSHSLDNDVTHFRGGGVEWLVSSAVYHYRETLRDFYLNNQKDYSANIIMMKEMIFSKDYEKDKHARTLYLM
jgi:hypothetical protein